LALWRYRYDLLSEETTEDDLIARFVAEFHITPAERRALFVDRLPAPDDPQIKIGVDEAAGPPSRAEPVGNQ
jgi:hypothetical protein